MKRRDVLAYASAAALIGSAARAQPMPVVSSTVPAGVGAGPLPSVGTPWGASLDLSFMTPGTMPSGVTFTRASTGTYFDSAGVLQTAAVNTPRWDYDPVTHALRGLLIEEARTNVLLNSATLVTQSVTVTATAYTLSFYGTGTVTLSGASTGSLVGTGAFPQRVSLTFTPAAGTLTCTVTGSVQSAQLEAGTFATSYIAVTAAAVTRAADFATMPTAAWFSATAGTLEVEFIATNVPPAGAQAGMIRLDDGTDSNNLMVFMAPQNPAVILYGVVATVNQLSATVVGISGAPQKAAVAYGGLWRGATGGVTAAGTGSATPLPATRLMFGMGHSSQAWWLDGYIRRVRYWPRALSNSELQQVTT
jgi:hypothetical protein